MKTNISKWLIAGSLVTGVSSQAAITLNGNYLSVGVGSGGALIDDGFVTGIKVDPTGTGAYGPADILRPGTPFEFYGFNIGGVGGSQSYVYGSSYSASTVDESTSTYKKTVTTGSAEGLDFIQTIGFNVNERTIHFGVSIQNNGSSSVDNVYYGRGLDPDPDVYIGGGYETKNVIGAGFVSGQGIIGNNLTLTIRNKTGNPDAVFSIDLGWSMDVAGLHDNPQNDGNGDNTINIAYLKSSLAPGSSWNLQYDYEISGTDFAPVPEPSTIIAGALLYFKRLRM